MGNNLVLRTEAETFIEDEYFTQFCCGYLC